MSVMFTVYGNLKRQRTSPADVAVTVGDTSFFFEFRYFVSGGPPAFFRVWQRWLLGVSRVRRTNEFDRLCLLVRDGWIETNEIDHLASAFNHHFEHCWKSGIKEFAEQYRLMLQLFHSAAYNRNCRIYVSGLSNGNCESPA